MTGSAFRTTVKTPYVKGTKRVNFAKITEIVIKVFTATVLGTKPAPSFCNQELIAIMTMNVL